MTPNDRPSDTPQAAGEDAARPDRGPGNFIDERVADDLRAGRHGGRLVTRFPPEPNGFLHIGHAKSICLNFGLAERHGGVCNLRFDDTNPEAEEARYVDAIRRDVRWLGFDWGEREHFASDYFEQLYAWAVALVRAGRAYVDSQRPEAIREGRGDFHRPGVESPYRDRPVEESLALLEQMRRGALDPGEAVLRAKIDMRSTDLKLRDPLMYRIRKAAHHRTGTAWSIYPMYDFAHGLSDAIEGVTHSLCTLEFQNHRPLYEWFIDAVGPAHRPEQIEFARLNLSYTVLSKRKLQRLVDGGYVEGWDDPRLPTLAGLRRRGYTPEAIRAFCDRIGVSKRDGVVDVTLLEHAIREDLNDRSPRAMAVLRPLRLVIDNYPDGEVEHFEVPNHPTEPAFGVREVPFSRVLYVERDDFMEDAPKNWWRLAPGREVRLRGACLVRCTEVVKDAAGEVVELRCTWDPASRGGMPADGRKVRGTLHWVSAAHAIPAEVRLYDRLFDVPNPSATEDDRDEPRAEAAARDDAFLTHLNQASLEVLEGCRLEPSLGDAPVGHRVQFERLGYFCRDEASSSGGQAVWNRTIALKDSWGKQAER
ncbi:MAG: glutamine--tRNA ligase/YqeY domain fusion protein [Myxococcales bacterium]|nr:glutamine--tRNA ligase/YqeY domain fusion protein [Myxococcales bacterium]